RFHSPRSEPGRMGDRPGADRWRNERRRPAEKGNGMKLKISQRSDEFFSLFMESARTLRTAAELLLDLIEDYRDVELKASRIRDREHEGDEITHAIIRLLNTTFVTPMD